MFENNELMTNLTPLGYLDEVNCWDNRPFLNNWPEDQRKPFKASARKVIRKKPKRTRTAYTTEQINVLENHYSGKKFIDSETRKKLARNLKLGEKNIKIWFQNRRMKEKRDSESSSDSLSEANTSASPPPDTRDAGIVSAVGLNYSDSKIIFAPSFPNIEQQQVTDFNFKTDINNSPYIYPYFDSQYEENIPYCAPSDPNGMNSVSNKYPVNYVNNMEIHESSNFLQNQSTFDGNAYPTQYYPSNGHDYNFYQANSYKLENYTNDPYALSGNLLNHLQILHTYGV